MRKRYVKAVVLDASQADGQLVKGDTVTLDLHSVDDVFDMTRTDYSPTVQIRGGSFCWAIQRFGIDPVVA